MNIDWKRSAFLCVVTMLTLVLSDGAIGQIFTNGNGNNDWNDPLNWDTGFVPAAGEGVFVGDDLELATAEVNITADIPEYGDLRVAFADPGTGTPAIGTVNHSAGTATATGWVFMGVDNLDTTAVNVGTYNLSGTGIWNTANTFLGVAGGVDGIRSAEGYLNISDSAQLNTGSLNVGNNDDNYGEVNQTGGTVTIDNWFNIGDNVAGQGVYNMSGGSISADQISVGQVDGASGEFHLSGDASVTQSGAAQGLRVGRGLIPDQAATFNTKAEGLLSITGGDVTVSVANLSVGGDETGPDFVGPTTTQSEGTLSFTSEDNAVSPILVSGNVLLNDGSVEGFADLLVDLETSPVTGDVVLVDLTTSTGAISGSFMGLPEGAAVPGSDGRTITYMYGADGNDIALIGAGLSGDFDNDGDVDGQDFLVWQGNPSLGSLSDWQNNYGAGNLSAVSSVPEPTSLALVALGLSLAVGRRRR